MTCRLPPFLVLWFAHAGNCRRCGRTFKRRETIAAAREAGIMALLENIRVFVRGVEFGSLSATGRQVRLSLAEVSHRLQQLDSHLGTRLLNRTPRQVSRPSPGWSATGRRILAPLVPEFQARHPQVDLRLRQAMRRPRPSSTRT
jgi:hypothetical protein